MMAGPSLTLRELPPVAFVRDRLKKRRWFKKHLERARTADAFVVSHTKSGRTWLRVMLSHLYQKRHNIPESELIAFDNFHEIDPAIPRVYFLRDTCVPSFWRGRPDVPIPDDRPTVFLVRDPRDVAISFWFHVRSRASAAELSRKGIGAAERDLPLFDFVMHPRLGVPRVIEHFNRWQKERRAMPKAITVRYEDMRADPARELRRVVELLGGGFDAAEIAAAVAFASFESLKEKERQGFFTSERMRPTEAEGEAAFKVRKGRVGGYRDHFTPEEAARLDALVQGTLDPAYGYGRPEGT